MGEALVGGWIVKPAAEGCLTYPGQGATRSGTAPDGYRVARRRIRVGSGRAAFDALAEGILSFDLHRGARLRVRVDGPRADPGVTVISRFGIGPLRLPVPCRVVWAEHAEARAGFGYGTLPGHPESGEESFRAVLADDGAVYFEVFAFSRHANWFYTLGAPVASACQRLVTRRYLAAARRLASPIPT